MKHWRSQRQRVEAARIDGRLTAVWLCLVLGWCIPSLGDGAGKETLPPATERLRLLFYNVYNFMPSSAPEQIKSPESRQAVIEILARTAPDIAVLAEVGGETALAEIRDLLSGRGVAYPFGSVVAGADEERFVAVLAKFAPVEVCHDVTAAYNLGGRHIRVKRGFAHCLFGWQNGYRLHVVGAHLKSKVYHPLGQTDMRRYEARQLRYLFKRIYEQDPDANVLIVGDFNDAPNSSPVSTLCGRRSKPVRQLFDLRPVDRYDMSWTHLWEEGETYSRIDYAFASYALLPEVVFEETHIPFFGEWYVASDHRPIVITIAPVDNVPAPEMLKQFDRNHRVLPAPRSSFHEGRVVGARKARR